jgi:hypothetical protein
MDKMTVGRLLRSNTRGCVVGCRISQSPPDFGSMIYIPTEEGRIFGLVHDIHIDDDGLVRQLAASDTVSEEVILDNRLNRNTPLEMSILFIGHERNRTLSHLLPPHPPLSLDTMYLCSQDEIRQFTHTGNFGYFRYLLTNPDLPTADLVAAHISAGYQAQAASHAQQWKALAIDRVIVLLRDNHDLLNQVLFAVSDAFNALTIIQED